jgi:hypothetical protein
MIFAVMLLDRDLTPIRLMSCSLAYATPGGFGRK